MSFLKRLKASRTSKSTSSPPPPPNTTQDDQNKISPSAAEGPLSTFQTRSSIGSNVDLGQHSNWEKHFKQKSRLSKTIREVLHDHSALSYLIQYLEARDAVQLVKFWLDVESFRASASTIITSNYVPPQVSRERLEIVPEFPEVSINVDEAVCEAETVYRMPDSSDSTESFDSGFARSERDSIDEKDRSTVESLGDSMKEEGDSPVKDKAPVASLLTNPSTPAPSRAEQFLQTRTEDAVKIYRRYIAPDCQRPVHLPTEYKRDIVELICAETGHVAPDCFDSAQEKVVTILEEEYFPDFLKSEYHVKHQVDLLTSGQVQMTDILYNDTALFHFMEFLESQGRRSVIEFWLAASNFQQSSNSANSQGDAMVLYDKYFSMQAVSPLGFSDEVRLQIENNICMEGGPDSSCFRWPLEITVMYMEQTYLQKFLASHLYRNYIKELIGTIQASPRSLSAVGTSMSCHSLNTSRRTDSDTHSTCSSSDLSSERGTERRGVSNTLLAGATGADQEYGQGGLFEEVEDPSLLWRRKEVRSKVGRVNSFGRYLPGLDLAPDMKREQGTRKGSRLGRVVRRLVTSDEHEKLKEEMAWQVAEMIVKDITSVTMPGKAGGQRTNSLTGEMVTGEGDEVRYSETRRKHISESLSLQDLSLEMPTAKYF